MHPNPVFRSQNAARGLNFARQRAFGILTVNALPVPLISHIPFCIHPEGKVADLHLVRSNPIVRSGSESQTAVLIVSGPDSYISPDWYQIDNQVPTWNYVAVHLHGTLERQAQNEIRRSVDTLSDLLEQKLSPKPVWRSDKVDNDVLGKMLNMIVPFQFVITHVDSTWKLSQNKPESAQFSAARHVAQHGLGQEIAKMAEFMSAPRSRWMDL